MSDPTDPAEPMPRRPLGPSPEEERGLRRALVARNLMLFLLAILVLGMLAGMTYTVVTIRASQVTNTQRSKDMAKTADATQQTLDLVQDCVTPKGECYRRGQEQTKGAVDNISRVVILAAACSVGVPAEKSPDERERLITTCVIQRLAEQSAP